MARARRYPFPTSELQPGRVFHVTNRGVDRCAMFHSDLDRIVFLALVADACVQMGVVVQAFCLMANHFHLVVEDSRGVLSLFMHRIESVYARYFNDTRPGRRVGPLYQGRFHADLIDTRAYFDEACSYVVNNPLRASPPLVASPDDYRWSSAAFVLGAQSTTAKEFCERLLEHVGGLDAVLFAFMPTTRAASEERRERRLRSLASGAWLEREHALDGRAPETYRAALARRTGAESPFMHGASADPGPAAALATAEGTREEQNEAAIRARRLALPARPIPFAGIPLDVAITEVGRTCERFPPRARKAAAAYLLMRFCATSRAEIARALRCAPAALAGMIARVRASRSEHEDVAASLWRVEWALHWRLLAAPFRL